MSTEPNLPVSGCQTLYMNKCPASFTRHLPKTNEKVWRKTEQLVPVNGERYIYR